MLRPYTVKAPRPASFATVSSSGDYVNPGTMLAHLGTAEVRSPVPGEVRALDVSEGAVVKAGDAVAELAADQNHVFEALRALYIVGTAGGPGGCGTFHAPGAGNVGERGAAGPD